jgi:S1-C subfamily serine protease
MRRTSIPVVAGFALAAGIGIGHLTSAGDRGPESAIAQPAATGQMLTEEQVVIRVVQQVTPAVVSVSVGQGSGSGVIVRSDGIILTNNHVVGNARSVQIGLADGQRVQGQVLGRDASIDVAVVRVPLPNLPAAPIGDSDLLRPGQLAIAIGNPLGLDRTVTRGVVSAVDRSPMGFGLEELIQTDAAINPGNSGGPLLDSSGRVIGLNTAVRRGAVGLGFAVPINLANEVAQQILTTGVVRRAFLGISYNDIQPAVAAQFRLPVSEGIIVMQVQANSPAARAGIQAADIVTHIGDVPVTHGGDLRRALRAMRPGQRTAMTVVRPSGTTTVNVTLGELVQR